MSEKTFECFNLRFKLCGRASGGVGGAAAEALNWKEAKHSKNIKAAKFSFMNLVSHQGWWSSQDWSYRKNNVVYLHVFFFLLSLLYQNKEDVLRGAIYRINKICWFPIVAASPGPTQALGKKRNNWHTSAPRYLWREYSFFQVVIIDYHILMKYLTNSRLYHCDLHTWTAQKEISQILWSKLSDWENMYDLRYKSLDNWTVHCSAKKPNE